MFDASFLEIVLILLVALIVIGPERLPRVARTIGLWVGRARAMFNTMRDEVEREIQIDELRKAERDLKEDLDLGLDKDVMADDPAGKRRSSGTSSGKGRSGAARPTGTRESKKTESEKTGADEAGRRPASTAAAGHDQSQGESSGGDDGKA